MTNEEINRITFEQWGPVIDVPPAAHRAFARAIIAAHTEKLLAGVEMPEPSGQRRVREDGVIYFDTDPPTEFEKSVGWKPIFTLDQLQVYAAAAALNARREALDDVGALATVGATYEEVMLYLQSEIEKLKGK